ncbi:MAG: hypothetical protein GF315_02775, partial [candidate division Zixibacteria bacterium]|nr:hypothetical protein [candidate division Zixibacteria bacterium]
MRRKSKIVGGSIGIAIISIIAVLYVGQAQSQAPYKAFYGITYVDSVA